MVALFPGTWVALIQQRRSHTRETANQYGSLGTTTTHLSARTLLIAAIGLGGFLKITHGWSIQQTDKEAGAMVEVGHLQ